MAFHDNINDVTTGVTHLVLTRSKEWEIHPMSIIFGYRIDTVLRALLFTGARSLIAATRLFCRTSNFWYRTSIIMLASSSPLTEFLTTWTLHGHFFALASFFLFALCFLLAIWPLITDLFIEISSLQAWQNRTVLVATLKDSLRNSSSRFLAETCGV